MPEEYITDKKFVIPAGLKRRWEKFGEQVRACWAEVHKRYPKAPATEAFEHYWTCMRTCGAHLLTVEEAKRYAVKPHPISVISKMAKGLTREEAEKQAIEEGKFHPISLMRAEMEHAGRTLPELRKGESYFTATGE